MLLLLPKIHQEATSPPPLHTTIQRRLEDDVATHKPTHTLSARTQQEIPLQRVEHLIRLTACDNALFLARRQRRRRRRKPHTTTPRTRPDSCKLFSETENENATPSPVRWRRLRVRRRRRRRALLVGSVVTRGCTAWRAHHGTHLRVCLCAQIRRQIVMILHALISVPFCPHTFKAFTGEIFLAGGISHESTDQRDT